MNGSDMGVKRKGIGRVWCRIEWVWDMQGMVCGGGEG